MTVTTTEKGYLEDPYLTETYLTGTAIAAAGMQAQFVIKDQAEFGMQTEFNIADFLNPQGMQTEFNIQDFITERGMQTQFQIDDQQEVGMQFQAGVVSFPDNNGMQANLIVADFIGETAMEAKADTLAHVEHERYLEFPYLEDPYLTRIFCAQSGMQAEFNIDDFLDNNGMQTEFNIVDFLDNLGMQTEFNIVDFLNQQGMQADAISLANIGMQMLATIYNTTNLRILCDFPSRGTPAQGGTNWTTNSQAAGDFDVNNLNTDITDQVYRSLSNTGVNIDVDTGLVQGVPVDTIAILNHNMTRAANLQIFGSNDPTFTTIGTTITPVVRDENIFWILPNDQFPLAGFRYWRFSIDDVTNTDSFIEIGTIVFGASAIFQGECLVDEIQTQLRDFADTIATEGFTNVANSRALRRAVTFEFRSLDFNRRNFEIIADIFVNQRTILKCLWIPTPNETNIEALARFAVFAKLAGIPVETHNSKGPDADFVSFTIELDESL